MMAEHVEESKKAIPKMSKVWEQFENKNAKHVTCKLHQTQLSFHGTTTARHEHLS